MTEENDSLKTFSSVFALQTQRNKDNTIQYGLSCSRSDGQCKGTHHTTTAQ